MLEYKVHLCRRMRENVYAAPSHVFEYSESERPSGSTLVRRPLQGAVVRERERAVLEKSLINTESLLLMLSGVCMLIEEALCPIHSSPP